MKEQNFSSKVGLAIHSFNVRGMRDAKKRKKIFSYLKQRCKGIIYLQETYTLPNDLNTWKKEWGQHVYLNHGTSHSCGVAILVTQGYEFETLDTKQDDKGRYIYINATVNGINRAFLNYYNPTSDKVNDQIKLLDEVKEIVANNSSILFWGGDFNMNMTKEDKDRNFEKPSKFVNKIAQLLEETDMTDLWRITNPEIRRYTWRRCTMKNLQQSRLDYIFAPTSCLYNLNKAEIIPSICSDHSIVTIELKEEQANKSGRGFWKFNSSLLHEKEYLDKINSLIQECKTKYAKCTNHSLKWDTIKMEIRGKTISYASHRAKVKREHELNLNKQIDKLEQQMTYDDSRETKDTYLITKKEIEDIHEEKVKGAQVRAKCMHLQNFETSSKYFFNKEKSTAETKRITSLECNNKVITEPKEILNEQKRYYEELYTETNKDKTDETAEATKYFMEQKNIPKIPEDDKDTLDLEITTTELGKALKQLPNNKTPGLDGLTAEFYKVFWSQIQNLVYDSWKCSIDNRKMSQDQRRGVLTLIPKKNKNIRELKNWRPLTLLNCDYKIFAKLMATRLQSVLSDIISTDQSGCIKGRSTFSNIRSTIDIINTCNEKNTTGLIAFIDYEKAFDTVRWTFMEKVLKKLNFGDYFRDCISLMYRDIETCVINNGHASTFFKPSRGIKQGCPISANLFVLIVEVLATAIRNNPKIIGIAIDGNVYKISQYADDTCLYLKNDESLQTVLTVLDLFKKCAGLKVNRDKSEAICIGTSSNYRHKTYGLKLTSEPVKTLGVYICNNMEEMIRINFQEKLDKIENILESWCLRKLTLKGRVLVANTMAISQLLYLSTVMYTPEWAINKYNKIIEKYVWQNKPAKVKYTTMIDTLDNGGLRLQDLRTKIKALKIKWIKNIIDKQYQAPWKSYISGKIKMEVTRLPYYNLNNNDCPTFNDKFYDQLFLTWSELRTHEPTDNEQVCREIIWYNSNIRIANKPIYYKKWEDSGINFIQDILNEQGAFAKKDYLENKYHIVIKFLEYQSLLAAIPAKWKKIIKKSNNNLGFYIFYDCKITVKKQLKTLEEITTKDIYWCLIDDIAKRPTSEKKWREKAQIDMSNDDWETVYTMANKLTRDTKIHDFQFKLTHRLIACRYNLVIWKIETDNRCIHCNTQDTIEHFFWHCKIAKTLWNQVLEWWEKEANISIPLQTYEILFGLPNDEKDPIINQLNYILQMTRYYIYTCKISKQEMTLTQLLLNCRDNITSEYKIKQNCGTQQAYITKWTPLIQAVTGNNGTLGKATLELSMVDTTLQTNETTSYQIVRN